MKKEQTTTDLKLAPFPTRSPLPFAALPSISLIPSARFTDWENGRAEAVRRAVERFLRESAASDLRSFFGASKTRGNILRHVAKLRCEWQAPAQTKKNFGVHCKISGFREAP
jgi:hypothetical protein